MNWKSRFVYGVAVVMSYLVDISLAYTKRTSQSKSPWGVVWVWLDGQFDVAQLTSNATFFLPK
jgi:hypothetical protein